MHINPPKYPSPMPQIPRQSDAPRLELLMQEIEDDEPTVKMRIPPGLLAQTRGPNWGLLLALAFCLVFWGSIVYLVWR